MLFFGIIVAIVVIAMIATVAVIAVALVLAAAAVAVACCGAGNSPSIFFLRCVHCWLVITIYCRLTFTLKNQMSCSLTAELHMVTIQH